MTTTPHPAPVHIGTPVVVPAPHWITTEAIERDLRARHPPTRELATWLRMLRATGVEGRPWVAPLEVTADQDGVTERSGAAYAGARALAVAAAGRALEAGGWDPGSVDCLVTTHTTSWTVPGLDVDLVAALGLRPTVARVGLATAACVGGAQSLVQAVRYVSARGGHGRVLVVAAEALSTLYRPAAPPTLQSVLYGGLFGDAAGAALVAGPGDVGPGLEVADPRADLWELVLPDSSDAYWGAIGPAGLAFDSGAMARRAPGRVTPHLAEWLEARPVQWAAVHPGAGPAGRRAS